MSNITNILNELSEAIKASEEFMAFDKISKKIDKNIELQTDFKAFESVTDEEEKEKIHRKIMSNALFLEYVDAKNNLDLLKDEVLNKVAEAFGLSKKGSCGGGCGSCGGGCGN